MSRGFFSLWIISTPPSNPPRRQTGRVMLPSRGRLIRITSACALLTALAYLCAVSTTWKSPSGVSFFFSPADDSGAAGDGEERSVSKPKLKHSTRLAAAFRQDGARKRDYVIQDRLMDKPAVLKGERIKQLPFTENMDGTRKLVTGDPVVETGSQPIRGGQAHTIPFTLTNLITSMSELKGRHSDFITGPCSNKTLSGLQDRKYGFIGPFPYLRDYKNPCWLPKGSTQVRCVPYFYLIGAPKAGSTDVFWRIKGHPHVTSGRAKEVRWFDRQRFPLEKGSSAAMPSFENYLEFFQRPTGYVQSATIRSKNGTIYHHRVIADGSPTYYYSSFNWRLVPGNEGCHEPRVTAMSHVHHLWPQAKLILVLRNPVTRLFSTYLYNTHLPGFNASAAQFDLWVKQSMETWFRCVGGASFRHCMYERQVIYDSAISTFVAGIYSRYVLDLLKIFPRKQIYFVHLESYSAEIQNTLRQIYSFLELPPLTEEALAKVSRKDDSKRNRGRNYAAVPEMWPSTRKLLEHFYAPYNAELSAILDGDSRWLW